MKTYSLVAAAMMLTGCGPDWDKSAQTVINPPLIALTCENGSAPNADGKCVVPYTCEDGSAPIDGKCLLTPVCSFPLTDGQCLLPATCPVALTDGQCLLTPVCPVALNSNGACVMTKVCPVQLTDGLCLLTPTCPVALTDGKCLLPVSCPEGSTPTDDGRCLLPVQCREGSTMDQDGDCVLPATYRKVCNNHANQNPETCSNGWLSVRESCDCPPDACLNPNNPTRPDHCGPSDIGSVYVP